MAQARSASKSVPSATDKSANGHDTPALEPKTTGDLSKIIAQLQKRLATVEKRQAATPRKRKAEPASDDKPDAATDSATPTASSALEARLNEFRALEQALHLEELALHTRAKAAQQEELLLQHESQTLQLKLRSFRTATQRLSEDEARLRAQFDALRHERDLLDGERQALHQARQELDALRHRLDADREALELREAALSAPLAALSDDVQSAHKASNEGGAGPGPWIGRVMPFCLAALALCAIIGLGIAIAWLTVTPVHRASAVVKGWKTESGSPVTALDEAVLRQCMQRLETRGLRPFASVEAMRESLAQDLHLRHTDQGAVEFTYDSPHRDEAVLIVDAIVRSLSASSTNPSVEGGPTILRAAAADLDPLHDGRPVAAIMWMTMLTLAAGCIMAFHAWRRKRKAS